MTMRNSDMLGAAFSDPEAGKGLEAPEPPKASQCE
jgi:hypothetical protein